MNATEGRKLNQRFPEPEFQLRVSSRAKSFKGQKGAHWNRTQYRKGRLSFLTQTNEGQTTRKGALIGPCPPPAWVVGLLQLLGLISRRCEQFSTSPSDLTSYCPAILGHTSENGPAISIITSSASLSEVHCFRFRTGNGFCEAETTQSVMAVSRGRCFSFSSQIRLRGMARKDLSFFRSNFSARKLR